MTDKLVKWGLFLTVVGLILSAIGLYFIYFTYQLTVSNSDFSNKTAENISSQLNDINKKISEIVPEKPDIKIFAYKRDLNKSDLELYKSYIYDCSFISNYLQKYSDNYTEVIFDISNPGKKTKNLKIYFNCNSNKNFFGICAEKGRNVVFEEYDVIYYLANIPEIESIKNYRFSLILYPSFETTSCSVEYSSDDISSNNINFLP